MDTQVFAKKMRRYILDEIYTAQSGHPGGSLSIVDLLSVLYNEEMNVSADRADDENRDRFVLSKGHACPALYAALALKGYIPVEDLKKFRNIDGYLEGHPDMKKIKGVDMSSGSLGQGISAACGMALIGKRETGLTEFILFSATERRKRARFGRLLCSRDIINSIIFAL